MKHHQHCNSRPANHFTLPVWHEECQLQTCSILPVVHLLFICSIKMSCWQVFGQTNTIKLETNLLDIESQIPKETLFLDHRMQPIDAQKRRLKGLERYPNNGNYLLIATHNRNSYNHMDDPGVWCQAWGFLMHIQSIKSENFYSYTLTQQETSTQHPSS